MLIKLHGIFADRYGREHLIEAGSAAEAIEGFTRQVNFFGELPLDQRPVVRVVGFDTDYELYENTEQKEIHLVPAMIGGGSFGRIVVGVALIAIAFIPGIGPAISAALISAGVGLTLSGVMALFTKAPTISKSTDPDASQYLGISDNTVAIGTPIPIQYGRGPATGHLLAINVDSNEMVYGQFPA